MEETNIYSFEEYIQKKYVKYYRDFLEHDEVGPDGEKLIDIIYYRSLERFPLLAEGLLALYKVTLDEYRQQHSMKTGENGSKIMLETDPDTLNC